MNWRHMVCLLLITALFTSFRTSGMFYGTVLFDQDISSWDTSKVKTMSLMFYNAALFNQNLSKWDVSSITDMESMSHCIVMLSWCTALLPFTSVIHTMQCKWGSIFEQLAESNALLRHCELRAMALQRN